MFDSFGITETDIVSQIYNVVKRVNIHYGIPFDFVIVIEDQHWTGVWKTLSSNAAIHNSFSNKKIWI